MAATISTAPPEIISNILLWVLPEDLENFAHCCKAVHLQANRQKGNNGLSLLQEHRILIQKYSALTSMKDVLPYLRAVTVDQRIRNYVREVNLGPSGKYNIIGGGVDDLLEDSEIYHVLISAAKTIQMDSLIGRYLSETREPNSQNRTRRTIRLALQQTDLTTALLLPLLPNLSTLSFRWRFTPEIPYNWTKEWITNLASSSVPILNKLKEVNVLSGNRGCILSEIVSLTALPSLQRLAVWHPGPHSFAGAPQFWSRRQYYPQNTVSRLELWTWKMETWMLNDYLASFNNLESFSLKTRLADIFDLMPPFALLLSHSKNTLTQLSLRSCNGNATAKPPFKRFEVLKQLHVDWQMLLPQPYVVGQNWEDLLPQSLEALIIHDDYAPAELKDWSAPVLEKRFGPVVEDVISSKKGGLPALKYFSFTAVPPSLRYTPATQPEFRLLSVGIDEVKLGFRNRCEPVGVCFSFKNVEE